MKEEGREWKIVFSWERENEGQQTTIYSPDLLFRFLLIKIYLFFECVLL